MAQNISKARKVRAAAAKVDDLREKAEKIKDELAKARTALKSERKK